jgi:hypothetical protein
LNLLVYFGPAALRDYMGRMYVSPAIRIILAEMPGLMGGVVRDAIKGQPDMGIVAEITENADVTDSVSNGQCDLVVATLAGSGVPTSYQALLFGDTPVPFIVLDPDGRRFQAFARSVRREFAVSELLDVIRRLANPDADSGSRASVAGSADDSTRSPPVTSRNKHAENIDR